VDVVVVVVVIVVVVAAAAAAAATAFSSPSTSKRTVLVGLRSVRVVMPIPVVVLVALLQACLLNILLSPEGRVGQSI
jgi:hypothetical protein